MASLALGLAACTPAGPLVQRPQFQPPLGSSGIGAAYFTIRAPKADRIMSVSSPEADAVEIHASVTRDGRVSMERLETVELPAGKTVAFAPGGMHLMVFSPKDQTGKTSFPITIELQSGTTLTVPFAETTGGAGGQS